MAWTDTNPQGQLSFPLMGWRHGTRSNYLNGCRCEPCKETARKHKARYRRHVPKHPAFRQRVYESTEGICYLCCQLIEPGTLFHIDHVYPRILGGSDDIRNLLPTHPRCNLIKANNPLLNPAQRG